MKTLTKMMLAVFAGAMTIASCSSNDDYTAEKKMSPKNVLLGQMSGETSFTDTIDGHEYVDLGLSVKWATMNVGATSHEDYGDYFAWGDITPYYTEGHAKDNNCSSWINGKTGYNWKSYKWCDNRRNLTKYCLEGGYGIVDNKRNLELTDDAARANWGGNWRMPTDEEMDELITQCHWEWTSNYKDTTGVAGYIVYKIKSDSDNDENKCDDSSTTAVDEYSISDTHIFLPATGLRGDTDYLFVGARGSYWTNSHNGFQNSLPARFLFFVSYGGVGIRDNDRWVGQSVRAVYPNPAK